MSNEIRVRVSLSVRNGETDYQSRPTSFTADQAGEGGPTPGQITATVSGTLVSFSELTLAGVCRIQNLDSVNFVTYGIWDATLAQFFPLGEALPGETWPIRLSRYLGQELVGTGTSDSADSSGLYFKADYASCKVLVEAFEA